MSRTEEFVVDDAIRDPEPCPVCSADLWRVLKSGVLVCRWCRRYTRNDGWPEWLSPNGKINLKFDPLDDWS